MKKSKVRNRTFSEVIVPSSPAEKAYWDGLAARSRELSANAKLRHSLKEITVEDIMSW